MGEKGHTLGLCHTRGVLLTGTFFFYYETQTGDFSSVLCKLGKTETAEIYFAQIFIKNQPLAQEIMLCYFYANDTEHVSRNSLTRD